MFRLLRRIAFRERTARERALHALRRGAYAEAEERLAALLEAAVPSAERAFLLNKRGVARAAQGRTEAAREDFTAAVACVAGYAPAVVNLGNLLLESGDLGGAIACYESAIRYDADCALAHFNLGVAYKRAGRLDDGVRSLRKAQRLEGRMGRKPTRGA